LVFQKHTASTIIGQLDLRKSFLSGENHIKTLSNFYFL